MHEFYEKMQEHLALHEQWQRSKDNGLSTQQVVSERYTDSELRRLVDSLRERPLCPIASFKVAAFIFEDQQQRFSEELRRLAADALADYVGLSSQRCDSSAAEIFIVWGTHRADHKPICLSLLRDGDAHIRATALSYAGSFLRPQDFSALFEFQHDTYVSEVAMGGPLRYMLRDHALRVLEQLTGCQLKDDSDCFETTAEGRISYRSWSPFLNWHERSIK